MTTLLQCRSISLLDKETRKEMSSRFSRFVFENKRAKKLDTLMESIQDILENNTFEDVWYDNVNKYIDESLRSKLMIECTHQRLIKPEHVSKKMKNTEALF